MVGTLIALVGAVGFFISIVDGWLDRRLPVAASVRSRAASVYAAISLVGALLILPLVVLTFLGLSGDEGEVRRAPLRPVGIGLLVVGVATVRWWFLRLHGADRPPRSLLLFGRASLAITVLLGLLIELPEIPPRPRDLLRTRPMARAELSMYMNRAPDEVFAFASDPATQSKMALVRLLESGWLDDGPMCRTSARTGAGGPPGTG